MADITTTPFGAAEHCRTDNWAAEYAKKLFVAEAANRTEAIAQEVIDRSSAVSKAVGDEKTAREAEDKSITKSGGVIDTRIAEFKVKYHDPLAMKVSVCEIKDTELEGKISAETAARERLRDEVIARIDDERQNRRIADSYHSRPQYVGTWLGGTSVWRVAVPLTALSELGYDMTKNVSVKLEELLGKLDIVNSVAEIIVLDYRLIFQNAAEYGPEAFATGVSERAQGIFTILYDDTNPDPPTHLYGWVEFAAADSDVNQ